MAYNEERLDWLKPRLFEDGYADLSRYIFEDVGFNPDAWLRRTIMRREAGRRFAIGRDVPAIDVNKR